ncbi:MAG: hypothetical protein ACJ0FE_00320 [Gammaproteobacteria bacterium]
MRKSLEFINNPVVIVFIILPPTLMLLGYLYEFFLLWFFGSALFSYLLLMGLELMLPDKYFERPFKEFYGLTLHKWLVGVFQMPIWLLLMFLFLFILFPNYDL